MSVEVELPEFGTVPNEANINDAVVRGRLRQQANLEHLQFYKDIIALGLEAKGGITDVRENLVDFEEAKHILQTRFAFADLVR